MEHGHFLFWKTVNVLVMFALLYYLLKKPISKFLSEGMNAITNRFENARKEKEEALNMLKEAESKLEEARKEAEKIVSMAKELGEREKEQIIKEAEATAERILKSSSEEIEREVQKAKSELREYAASKAVELARQQIKDSITPSINEDIIKSKLSQLAKEGTR